MGTDVKRLAVTLLTVLAVVILTACGSSSSARAATEGWPTAATTGPTAWAMKQADWRTMGATTITKSGTYTRIHFTGTVTIKAANVRLVNDTVTSSGDEAGIWVGGANAYISRVIVSGLNKGSGRLDSGIKDIDGGGDIPSTIIDRTEVRWARTGIQDVTGVIENSYVHAPGYISGDHVNGIMQNGSSDPLLIKHNRVLDPMDQTAAIDLFCDFGYESNVDLENNWLAGGGYAFYGGQGGNEGSNCPTHDIVVENNVFSTQFYPDSGYWGVDAYYQDSGSGNVWAGNRLSSGAVIGS